MCSATGNDTIKEIWLTRWQSTNESSTSALMSRARARMKRANATRRAARADCGAATRLDEGTTINGSARNINGSTVRGHYSGLGHVHLHVSTEMNRNAASFACYLLGVRAVCCKLGLPTKWLN